MGARAARSRRDRNRRESVRHVGSELAPDVAKFLRITESLFDRALAATLAAASSPGRAEGALDLLPRLVKLEGGSVWRGGWSLPTTLAELGARVGIAAESLRRRLAILRRAGIVAVQRLGRRGIRVALTILQGVGAAEEARPRPASKASDQLPSPPVRREPDPALVPRVLEDRGAVLEERSPSPSEADLDRAVAQREREHDALRPDGRRERPPIRDRRAWRAAVRRGLRADPEALREALARADAREAEAERARRAREARQAEGARALDAASSARQVLERDRAERAAAWASYQALGADERARVDAEAWAKVPDPASPLAASRHRAAVEAIMRARRTT